MPDKTILLSEQAPSQSENHPNGFAYRMGDMATIFERDGKFGFCFHGIGQGGNYYESDDFEGFDSPEDAEAEARYQYEESQKDE